MEREFIFTFLILVISMSIISADVNCNPNFVTENYNKGVFKSSIIQCSNSGNSSVAISKTGDFFSIDQTIIGASPSSKSINISFNPNSLAGSHSGSINFNDGSTPIPIIAIITEVIIPQEEGCRLIELPHTTNYRIKQGETGASSKIRIKVSSECNKTMERMSVVEQTQMSKPMFLIGQSGDISPGDEFEFTVGLDAEGVSTGTYSNTYIISGSLGNNVYQKSITLSTIVTVGTSPVNDDTFSTMPSCTIDSDMSINKTYSLVCNNENPNVLIEVPYNPYFEGVSVSESEGKFTYKIEPVKTGNTQFMAYFKYKGVLIGNPFIKDVRITQGSVPLQGTQIEVLFYQAGNKKSKDSLNSGECSLLVKDTNTQNIVSTFKSYLNGVESTNNTITLQTNKYYELIVDSPGYQSRTINFTVSESPIIITLNPQKDVYIVGDVLNITDNANASYTFSGTSITSPYELKSEGTFTLKAIKEGYTSSEKNITIESNVRYTTMIPLIQEWKKGKSVTINLNKNVSWEVYVNEQYKQDGFILYRAPVLLSSGDGTRVDFVIEKYGQYDIKTKNGYVIFSNTLEKKGYTDWLPEWSWYVWVIIIALLVFLGYILFFKKSGSAESNVGFEMSQK